MSHAADPNKRADKCGNPFPDVCTPTTIQSPVCYLTTALQGQGVTQGIPGLMVIDIAADCSGTVTGITTLDGTPVPGAFQVPCPGTIGPGGFGSGQGNGGGGGGGS